MFNKLINFQLRRAQIALYQNFIRQMYRSKLVGTEVWLLTPGQIATLIRIRKNAGMTQTELANAERVERSTLGEMIERLENRQLVERRKFPTDRRKFAIYITQKGETLLDQVVSLLIKHEADVTQNWDIADKKTLIRLLQKLGDVA